MSLLKLEACNDIEQLLCLQNVLLNNVLIVLILLALLIPVICQSHYSITIIISFHFRQVLCLQPKEQLNDWCNHCSFFSFLKVLKRLKKLHPEGRNGCLPLSDCVPDKPIRPFPHGANSTEAHDLTPKKRMCREFATNSTKLMSSSSPPGTNQAKKDASKLMRSREQTGKDYDIRKTIKEPPLTDIGPTRLKVTAPSFPSNGKTGSSCRMMEGNKKTDRGGFMSGVSSRAWHGNQIVSNSRMKPELTEG